MDSGLHLKTWPRLAGLAVLALVILLTLALFVPIPIPHQQDFSVMYYTDRGLLNGIPIYDYPAQVEFVRGLTSADFTFHPYPYPPWYALATLPLGLFPPQASARLWFFANLGILALSAWLLTPQLKPLLRLIAGIFAIMFIPAFGLLVVGQYSAPVLLGAALFAHAAREKSPSGVAIALLLLTFKPHIGGLIFAAGAGWLVWLVLSDAQQRFFARRALLLTLAGGVLLAALGLLADPRWPITYLQSLGRYRDIPGVQTCGLCASLSVGLVRLVSGQSSTAAGAVVSLALMLGLGGLIWQRYRAWLKTPDTLIVLASVLTLLVDPYLLNYDYVLLLAALFWLGPRQPVAWLVYLAPWGLLALGREGNALLALAGIVTFVLILRQPIDALNRLAYNELTTK